MSENTGFSRVQFDLSQKELEVLDNIKVATDAATRAEVVRRALKFYEWIAEQDPNGVVEIYAIDKNGKRKLVTNVPIKLLL